MCNAIPGQVTGAAMLDGAPTAPRSDPSHSKKCNWPNAGAVARNRPAQPRCRTRRRPRRLSAAAFVRDCSVQVVPEPAGGVARPQLAKGLLLDLPDPLAGQTQPR